MPLSRENRPFAGGCAAQSRTVTTNRSADDDAVSAQYIRPVMTSVTNQFCRSRWRQQAGVTIVELMVAMVVAAVALGLALPAFNGLMLQQDMAGKAIDFKMAVNLARSEAVRRGANVSVVAINPGADNEWGGGFCVAPGAPADCANTLRTWDPADADRELDMLAPLHNVATLTFNPRGLLNNLNPGQTALLEICSTDVTEDPGRTLTLSAMGRTSVEELICHP